MEISPERKKQINTLVDELTKDKPNLSKVKSSMESLGLKYSDDPVERLNTVLMSMHTQIHEPEAMKEI